MTCSMTPLSWRVFRSRGRIVVKLTRDEREFLRDLSLPFALFPTDLDKEEMWRVANSVDSFMERTLSLDLTRHLKRKGLWSLGPNELGEFRELMELRWLLLELCRENDVLFTLK